ncbi:MAG: hypothetical protein IJV35_05905 [Neisseriaceae bacterium]|nr:hypothetical protein [Neisseriaceae bacterium]
MVSKYNNIDLLKTIYLYTTAGLDIDNIRHYDNGFEISLKGIDPNKLKEAVESDGSRRSRAEVAKLKERIKDYRQQGLTLKQISEKEGLKGGYAGKLVAEIKQDEIKKSENN